MIPTDTRPTKKQQQGEQSRELILDATERLMATRGYAATSINDIRKACGLPPSSIYWHFGSKEGVLAAVMERGAKRYFAAIPTEADFERQLAAVIELQEQHPEFKFIPVLSREKSGWEGRTGYVHPVYEELFSDKRPAYFYVCGWPAMIKEARQRIEAMGYDKKRIKFELYD